MQMLSESKKNWLGGLTDRYHETLLQSEETLSYLASRALDRDAVVGARLGLVTDPDPNHDQYQGRLAIPFLTPTGVVHMRFRCLEEHAHEGHGKYESPAGESTTLYNVEALHRAGGTIAVCEGEFDALVSTVAGLPAVGVPGVQSWKPYYYRLFEDFERVILLGDGDKAGRQFVNKLAPNIKAAVPRPTPEDYDVSKYVVEYGEEGFLAYALQP